MEGKTITAEKTKAQNTITSLEWYYYAYNCTLQYKGFQLQFETDAFNSVQWLSVTEYNTKQVYTIHMSVSVLTDVLKADEEEKYRNEANINSNEVVPNSYII